MRDSHFLFLGYSMRDWSLRVFLQRIWGEQRLGRELVGGASRGSIAVERELWDRFGVERRRGAGRGVPELRSSASSSSFRAP